MIVNNMYHTSADMRPLISIIIPVYNVEKYLRQCIDSMLGQTYQELEIILVDDGSTDASATICDEYSRLDKRCKVIHKSNGGLSSARNAGLDIKQGEYVAFIDSDDWIRDDMIEVLYDNIVKYHADIGQCDLVKTQKENMGSISIPHKEKVYSNIEMLYCLQKEITIANNVVWNKLYKAELFRGIRFPEGKIHEDEFVNYQLYYKAKRIVCSNQKLYYYRQRINSITKRFNLARLDKLDALKGRTLFYQKLSKDLYQKELIHFMQYLLKTMPQVKTHIKSNSKVLLKLRKEYLWALSRLIKVGYRKKELWHYILYVVLPDSHYRNI